MASGMNLLLKRSVPLAVRNPFRRAHGMLFMHKRTHSFSQREQFFNHAFRALSFNGIDGDYAEFGCGWKTFSLAYHCSRKYKHTAKLWGFDSFEGLPPQEMEADEHHKWNAGTMVKSLEEFKTQCSANGVPEKAYTLTEGYYKETIEQMAPSAEPKNIALAYIDCDLYSSTISVLQFLETRLKHGMIIACDDYHCWSATQLAGERKAMQEFFDASDQWSLLPYLPIGWHGQSFVVESKQLLQTS